MTVYLLSQYASEDWSYSSSSEVLYVAGTLLDAMRAASDCDVGVPAWTNPHPGTWRAELLDGNRFSIEAWEVPL